MALMSEPSWSDNPFASPTIVEPVNAEYEHVLAGNPAPLPNALIVAVPVGAPETCRALAAVADQVICARTPTAFSAVGEWYQDFTQTTDEEVVALLSSSPGPT